MIISANAIEEIQNTTATMSAEEINDYIRVINDPHYHNCDFANAESQAFNSIDRVLSELMTCSYPDEALPMFHDWQDMDESERAEWCKEQGIEQDGTEYGKWADYCQNECGKYLDELSEFLKNIREQRKLDTKISEDSDKDLLSPKISIEPVSPKKETTDNQKMKL